MVGANGPGRASRGERVGATRRRPVDRLAASIAAMAIAAATLIAAGPAPAAATPPATERTALDAGSSHTCAITPTGGLRCWGDNGFGQLGDGTTDSASTPVTVTGLTGVVAVATGSYHTCALTSAGAVRCWGLNGDGQVGDGSTTDRSVPTSVSGLGSGVAAIAAGGSHTCAATDLGAVRCWGENDRGQLGVDPVATASSPVPVAVTGLASGAVDLALGGSHSCAITTAGAARCWGANASGQLGRGSVGSDVHTPADVSGLATGARSLAAGGSTTCAVTTAGAARCWGEGNDGRLGNGASADASTPVPVSGLGSGVRSIDHSGEHGCVVRLDQQVRCWGRGRFGQLGGGSGPVSSATPVTVPALQAADVATADAHTCALEPDGELHCWGLSDGGWLGNGSQGFLPSPTSTAVVSGAVALGAGGDHTCLWGSDDRAYCFGRGDSGQLGNGTATSTFALVAATPLTNIREIGSGARHSCAPKDGGGVRCWGKNDRGQLGDGTTTDSTVPVEVDPIPGDVVAIDGGNAHTCAVNDAGAAYCWGDNSQGQIGDGTNTDRLSPVLVSGLGSGVSRIATGRDFTCAVRTDGTVRCWGRGASGQLGNGSNGGSSSPVTVSGIASGATRIAAGGEHACAIVSGAARCWGSNSFGQLGVAAPTSSNVPVSLPTLTSGVSRIIATSASTCARVTGEAVACWGNNRQGTVGSAAAGLDTNTPTVVIPSGIADLSGDADGSHVCAKTVNFGQVQCWGESTYGQTNIDPGFTPQAVTGGAAGLPTGAAWAPFSSWAALVNQQHLDLLGRLPSASVRNQWVGRLSSGSTTPGDLHAALRLDTDQTASVDPTTRLYFAYFLRIPDRSGLDYWIGKKRGGMLLRTISDSFASSSEFQRRYGTLSNRQFVELIYENLFDRPGDPGGVDFWTRRLDTRAETRGGVMASFSESSEYKRKMASEVSVSILSLLVLRQQPTQAAFDRDVARLDAPGATEALLARNALDGPTYAARFD